MENLKNIYTALLTKISDNPKAFVEERISIFNYSKGSDYDNLILVIGRSVNGWHSIHKNEALSEQNKVLNRIGVEDMQWTIDSWGEGNSYNTKRSAFWRLNKKVADFLYGEDANNFNKLAWSNLYKISKPDEGNPSQRLCNFQFELAREILREEVRLLRPKYIIFNTGLDWVKPFLTEDDNVKITELPENMYVKAIGTFYESTFIVGQHPQGKPEMEQLNEIVKYMSEAK